MAPKLIRNKWLIIKGLVLTFIFVVIIGCGKEDQQAAVHFNSVQIGDTREVLIARMGLPHDRGYSNFIGLSHETLVWCTRGTRYKISLFNDRVVSKEISQEKQKCMN